MRTGNKRHLVLFVLLAMAFSLSAATASGEEPSGSVSIETTSLAAGVGFQWGHGVLKFQGKEYKFRLQGLSVVEVGISNISATGKVYNLSKMSDFPGTFTAVEAGVALGAGAGAQAMVNQYGVVMTLTSTQSGLQFKLAPEGIKIQLESD
jgi:hypothetical protein